MRQYAFLHTHHVDDRKLKPFSAVIGHQRHCIHGCVLVLGTSVLASRQGYTRQKIAQVRLGRILFVLRDGVEHRLQRTDPHDSFIGIRIKTLNLLPVLEMLNQMMDRIGHAARFLLQIIFLVAQFFRDIIFRDGIFRDGIDHIDAILSFGSLV